MDSEVNNAELHKVPDVYNLEEVLMGTVDVDAA